MAKAVRHRSPQLAPWECKHKEKTVERRATKNQHENFRKMKGVWGSSTIFEAMVLSFRLWCCKYWTSVKFVPYSFLCLLPKDRQCEVQIEETVMLRACSIVVSLIFGYELLITHCSLILGCKRIEKETINSTLVKFKKFTSCIITVRFSFSRSALLCC